MKYSDNTLYSKDLAIVEQVTEMSYKFAQLLRKMVQEYPEVAEQYFAEEEQEHPEHYIQMGEEDSWYHEDVDVVINWQLQARRQE